MYQSGPLSSCFLGFLVIFLFVGSSRTVVVRDMDRFYWRLVGGLAWRIFLKTDMSKIPLVGMDLMNSNQIIHIPRLLKHPTKICVCPTVVQSAGYL